MSKFSQEYVGSPPRMRGKASTGGSSCSSEGITPAYAGKRRAGTGQWACHRDHPRVCGEKKALHKLGDKAQGSPPRMRGKDIYDLFQALLLGITPAYAGKSAQLERPPPLAQDHPRVCGEKHFLIGCYLLHRGSPPRMRGKGHADRPVERHIGITPAYAGKSAADSGSCAGSKDHPRVCGEK